MGYAGTAPPQALFTNNNGLVPIFVDQSVVYAAYQRTSGAVYVSLLDSSLVYIIFLEKEIAM